LVDKGSIKDKTSSQNKENKIRVQSLFRISSTEDTASVQKFSREKRKRFF